MTTNYSVYLNTPDDTRLAVITRFNKLHYTRSVNQVGAMSLSLPASIIDSSFLKKDTRLEIWRSISSSTEYLETKTQWFVRNIQYDYDNKLYVLTAYSGLDLVRRRYIIYDDGTAEAVKSGLADDIIVDYVGENLGSSAASGRAWSSYITVLSSPGNGPTIYRAASEKNLLDTIQEIAQDAATAGTFVFFDMEYDPGSKLFIFKTFTQQRGIDHSTGQNVVTLSPEFGSLSDVNWENDYSDEVTFAYTSGKGLGGDRNLQSSSDSTRISESPFGRIELMVSGGNSNTNNELISMAQAEVRAGRPRRIIQARIVNRPGTEYGINWGWGDRLKAQINNQVYTVRIDTIEVDVSGGNETINAGIRIE